MAAAPREWTELFWQQIPTGKEEAIAWHTATILSGGNLKFEIRNLKFSRVVFHQITKDAILDAMKHPRELDMNLVDAQQARRILDRMVGYQLSPVTLEKNPPRAFGRSCPKCCCQNDC